MTDRLEKRWETLGIAEEKIPDVLHLISPTVFPIAWSTEGNTPERAEAQRAAHRAGGWRPAGTQYQPEHYATTRKCLGRCGKVLTIGQFGKRLNGPGGRATRCRVCELLRVGQYDRLVSATTGQRRPTKG